MKNIKFLFTYFLILWPFIYSNARLISQEGGTEIYSIFSFIGPEIRYLEAFLFIVLNVYFFILFILSKSKISQFETNIFLLFFGVLIVSIVSIAEGLVPETYIFRASYELLCPFLVFNIASKLNFDQKIIDNFIKILFFIMIINCFVIFHQFLFLFNGAFVDGDYFRGIFSDAHVQAIFSYSSALFIISNENYLKKFFYIIPINIFCAFLSSNEKASIFFLIVLLLIIFSKLSKRNIFISLLILTFSLINIDFFIYTFSPRILEYSNNFSFTELLYYSGPFQMLLILFEQFSLSFKNIFFGIGPALFGGPSSISLIQNFMSPNFISDIFYVEAFGQFNFLPLSGFFSKSSFYLTILGEFGIVVFLIFMLLLKNILSYLLELNNNILRKPLLYIFIFILLCALLSSYSVWDSQIVLTPFFLIFSFLISNNQPEKYEKQN